MKPVYEDARQELESKENYIDSVCPKCKCNEYEDGVYCDYFGLNNDYVTERICKHCGCVYTMIYKLVEVSEVETK